MTPQEYLSAHGLSEAFVTKKLGWKLHDDRIDIPVFSPDKQLLYTRTRLLSGDTKFIGEKGSHPDTLYGIHLLPSDATDIVFCEGEPDCARLIQAGIPAITFPSGVNSFSAINKAQLASLSGKTVYLAFDNDPAGQSQTTPVAQSLSEFGITVKILSFPAIDKDISEYFLHGSIEEFYTFMDNAKDIDTLLDESFAAQYPIVSTQDFLAIDYPQPTWLIENLIRRDGISLLVGESGTGKTIFSLSVVKALQSGAAWLDRYATTPTRSLILDKENTPADIQKLCRSMGINTDTSFHLFANDDYQLLNESGELTPVAHNLSRAVSRLNISLIVLDSVVDFLVGDENSSVDVSKNINAWKSIFPNCTILGIHHEGKTPIKGKRSASDRIRGSSHWKAAAQSVLSLSVVNPLAPSTLLVEHTKVRGGAKCQPFEIEMVIRPEEDHTIVTGYRFLRSITEEKLVSEKAIDIVVTHMAHNPKHLYTSTEILDSLTSDELSRTTILSAIESLKSRGDIVRTGEGKKNYPYLYSFSNAENYEEIEQAIDSL